MQVSNRFPLLHPLQYLALPFAKLSNLSVVEAVVRNALLGRIERRGNVEHVDFFDFIVPLDLPVPSDPREQYRIGVLAQQMMFANFGSISDWFYGTLLFLTDETEHLEYLSKEIRDKFESYHDINSSALASLPFLHACLEESLRLLPGNNTGLPRLSPGAIIDRHYVPKGVSSLSTHLSCFGSVAMYQALNFIPQTHVQTSIFALTRSPRFYHDPLHYRPQRWLPSSHPLYDRAFANDDLKAFHPFSLGPRACVGRELAWIEAKLFMAKVLWMFDVVRVPGQQFDLERTLLHYGFLAKPELMVRFVPVARKGE
jgi:hypothetical protein